MESIQKATEATPALLQGGEKSKAQHVKEVGGLVTALRGQATDWGNQGDQAIADANAMKEGASAFRNGALVLTSEISKIRGAVTGAGTNKITGLFGQDKKPKDATVAEREAKAAADLKILQIQRVADAQKAADELEQSSNEHIRKTGEESDSAYYSNKFELLAKERDEAKDTAQQTYDTHVTAVKAQNATDELKNEQIAKLHETLLKAQQDADQKYTAGKQKTFYEIDDSDRRKQSESIQQQHQNRLDQLQEQKEATSDAYSGGDISLDEKFARDKDYYAKAAAEAKGYYLKLAVEDGLNVEQLLKHREQYDKTLHQLNMQQMKEETDIAKQKITLATQVYDEQIALAKEQAENVQEQLRSGILSPVAGASLGRSAIRSQVGTAQDKVDFLQSQLDDLAVKLKGETNPYFESLSKQLITAREALAKFQEQLQAAPTRPQAAVGQLAGLLQGGLLHGGSTVGGFLQSFQNILGFGPTSPTALGAQGISAISGPQYKFSSGTSDSTSVGTVTSLTDKFSQLGKSLGPVIAGFAGFASIIGNKNMTVGQGLAAGASAGGGLGAELGGAIAGTSSSLGPILGMVGSLVGGMVGMIASLFERAARHIAETVQNAITKITLNFQEGSATLATTLTQLEEQRTLLIQQESGAKGGQQYLNQMLPGINQQIAQLIQQQQQIINTFEAQAEVINLGPGFSDTANQINQIIQQWNQYVSAGGNVVTANKYLTESFQQLDQTTVNQLDQSYASAIQSALQYNDLLIQRQQLVQSAAQQEASIMNQGVLTRQYTTAQTKAFQIGQIQNTTNQQLQQLNEQIQVSAYQLKVNQQVFDLTGTRVDLENKLANVQMQVINYDMIRITALSELVSQMGSNQAGVPLGSFISQLLQTYTQGIGATGTSYPALAAALAALGVNNTTSQSSNSPLQALFNQYFQQMGRQGSYAAATPTSGVPGAQ